MSILIKAGTGLVAGVVAGGLGLAFFPHVEPSALTARNAVEKPHFVVAAAASSEPVVQAVAGLQAETPAAKPKPAPSPESKPAPQAIPTPLASATPVVPATLAKLDPPKAPPSPVATPAETRAVATPQTPAPTPVVAANDAAARWSVRGLVALAKGDLSSARLFLARAAEAGDPRAFVALADTFDPVMLTKLGVVVAPGDAQRAKDYLVKAAAGGVVVKDRMAALDSAPQTVR